MISINFFRILSRPVGLSLLLAVGACGHPSGHSDPRPVEPAPAPAPAPTAKPLETVVKTPTEDAVERKPVTPATSPNPATTPDPTATPAPAPTPDPALTPAPAPTPVVKTLSTAFAARCSGCHGAAGLGAFGSNLTTSGKGFAEYSKVVRSGTVATGGAMPPIKLTKYSDADLANDFTALTGKAAQ